MNNEQLTEKVNEFMRKYGYGTPSAEDWVQFINDILTQRVALAKQEAVKEIIESGDVVNVNPDDSLAIITTYSKDLIASLGYFYSEENNTGKLEKLTSGGGKAE